MTILTPRPISLGEQDAATNDATEEIDVDYNDVHTTWEIDAAVEKELRPLRKE